VERRSSPVGPADPDHLLRVLPEPELGHGEQAVDDVVDATHPVVDELVAAIRPDHEERRHLALVDLWRELDIDPGQLVRDLEIEFGRDGSDAVVERFAEAKLGEFVWDGRIAERDLGAYESEDDDEFEDSERVRTLSIFRSRYRVATCVVDRSRRLQMMLVLHDFDDLPSAEIVFRNGD
jgi:hypothetical protein